MAKFRIQGSVPLTIGFKIILMKILGNFVSPFFCFHTFGVRRSTFSVSRRAVDPDPVRISTDPDPGWFSGSRASMERLTQKN